MPDGQRETTGIVVKAMTKRSASSQARAEFYRNPNKNETIS